MKNLLLAFIIVLLSSCATNTSFNTFYQKNQKNSDFSLGINSALIRGFLPDEDYDEVKTLLKKAKNVKILVFTEESEMVQSRFDKFINRSDFDDLIRIKSDNDKIKIYSLEKKDRIKEIILEISSDGDLILLGLKTNISEKDLNNLLNDNQISLN